MKYIQNKIAYSPNQLLGKGTISMVYKGYDLIDKQDYAIKLIESLNKQMTKELLNKYVENLQKQQKLKHDNVIELKDFFFNQERSVIYLVLEICEIRLQSQVESENKEKTLDYINNNPQADKWGGFSERYTLNMIDQIAQALIYLHEKNIIYGQLRPSNILVKNGIIKLAELGYSRLKEPTIKQFLNDMNLYLSPDHLLEQKNYLTCDLWSLGIVFYQMIYGNLPFQYTTLDQYKIGIRKNIFFPPQPPISDRTKQLIKGLLKLDRNDRISLQVLQQQIRQIKFQDQANPIQYFSGSSIFMKDNNQTQMIQTSMGFYQNSPNSSIPSIKNQFSKPNLKFSFQKEAEVQKKLILPNSLNQNDQQKQQIGTQLSSPHYDEDNKSLLIQQEQKQMESKLQQQMHQIQNLDYSKIVEDISIQESEPEEIDPFKQTIEIYQNQLDFKILVNWMKRKLTKIDFIDIVFGFRLHSIIDLVNPEQKEQKLLFQVLQCQYKLNLIKQLKECFELQVSKSKKFSDALVKQYIGQGFQTKEQIIIREEFLRQQFVISKDLIDLYGFQSDFDKQNNTNSQIKVKLTEIIEKFLSYSKNWFKKYKKTIPDQIIRQFYDLIQIQQNQGKILRCDKQILSFQEYDQVSMEKRRGLVVAFLKK